MFNNLKMEDKSNLEINLSKAFSKDDLIESDDIDSFLENKNFDYEWIKEFFK